MVMFKPKELGPNFDAASSSISRGATTGDRVRVTIPDDTPLEAFVVVEDPLDDDVKGIGLAPRLPFAGLLSLPEEDNNGLPVPFTCLLS